MIYITDLRYGPAERQIADLCLPDGASGDTGLVLFIHGGAWVAGDKKYHEKDAADIAEKCGCAAAAMNYRYLSLRVRMSDIVDDITSALSALKDEAKKRGVNLNKVLFTGISAGAHLSMLYAYRFADISPIEPAAVVSRCGPADLADENFYNGTLADMPVRSVARLFAFGGGIRTADFMAMTPEERALAVKPFSPICHVSKNSVPTVLAQGLKDTIVPYTNAISMNAALEEYGVPHRLITYPNSGHGLDKDPDEKEKTDALLIEYANAMCN